MLRGTTFNGPGLVKRGCSLTVYLGAIEEAKSFSAIKASQFFSLFLDHIHYSPEDLTKFLSFRGSLVVSTSGTRLNGTEA
jgi:hypothetical protein